MVYKLMVWTTGHRGTWLSFKQWSYDRAALVRKAERMIQPYSNMTYRITSFPSNVERY